MERHLPGTMPGNGDTVQRNKTNLVWAPGLAPRQNEGDRWVPGNNQAGRRFWDAESAGIAGMKLKKVTQLARSREDRREHFSWAVSQVKNRRGRVWPAEGTIWAKTSKQCTAGWRSHEKADVAERSLGGWGGWEMVRERKLDLRLEPLWARPGLCSFPVLN